MASRPRETDVAVLCGGLGQRLRGRVPDRPKPLAKVGGRPFLDILIEYVAGFGFRRFVLCAGYKAEMIEEHFGRRDDLEFLVSKEKDALGTGGALKHAGTLIGSKDFLVLNGDSLCNLDMVKFLEFHDEKKALASIALVEPEAEADYGAVAMDPGGEITSFSEKTASDSYINAGVYLFSREILELIPSGREYSLEIELFPSILDRKVYGFVTGAKLIDIGTAERYERAQDLIRDILRGKAG